jgi:hypothetical protein
MSTTSALTKRLTNYDNKDSVASRFRAKRIAPLLEIIEAVFHEHGFVNIVDLGGEENYWNVISPEYLDMHKVNITIVNLPGMNSREDHGCFKFIAADGCNLVEFGNNSFDIAHSNSVVEHVGDWGRMVAFAKELSRISPRHFVQTPNYWFPIEPHCMTPFIHWLPKPLRIWLVLHFQLGNWHLANTIDEAVRTVESARLLTKEMMQELFKDSNILTERFCWLPKSLIAIKKS